MLEKYGPGLTFLGWVFLFYGVVNLFIVIWHQHKYKEASATISSCRKYSLVLNGTKKISFALVLDFSVNNQNHKVRQNVSIEEWAFLDKTTPYIVGKELKIYYKRKNPNDINLDLRNFYKRSSMLCLFFLILGLITLFFRSYFIP